MSTWQQKKRKKNTPVLHLYSTLTRMIPENTTQLFWQNKFLSFFCPFSFLGLISITVSDRYIKRLTNKSLECRSSDWEENFVYRGNQLDENIVLSQYCFKGLHDLCKAAITMQCGVPNSRPGVVVTFHANPQLFITDKKTCI